MKSTSKTKKQFGFTLLELLVVVSIISLMMSSVLAVTKVARVKAKDTARKDEIKQIITAMNLYYDKNNFYPAGSPNVALTGADLSTATGLGFMDQLYLESWISKPINTGGVGWVYYPNTGTALNISTRQGMCGTNIGTGVVLQFRFENNTVSADYPITGGTWNYLCFRS